MQARFEGDGSILRLELSRPKKDPLLFFIEDSGFGLSRECMCTGLTGELGLAGRNQPKNSKKKKGKSRLELIAVCFEKYFLTKMNLQLRSRLIHVSSQTVMTIRILHVKFVENFPFLSV